MVMKIMLGNWEGDVSNMYRIISRQTAKSRILNLLTVYRRIIETAIWQILNKKAGNVKTRISAGTHDVLAKWFVY